jgi:acetyl esterase/lipase
MIKKRQIISFGFLIALILAGTGCADATDGNDASYFSTANTASDVIHHPLFAGFGQFILPLERGYEEDMPLSRVSSLLPYHSNIDPQGAVDTINHMLDEAVAGNTIFYSFYEDAQMQEHTGLFFFRGEPDAPFAVVCAGGGFLYVGSVHEGFPLAIQLAKQGYNAFVIQYRTGGADVACEDLATTLSFIFAHSEELKVSTEDYSLWGGSAGARMVAYLGSHGPAAFGGDELPRPATIVMQYTGHTEYTKNDPPTFAIIGENDGIASPNTMARRIDALKAAGVDTDFHIYPNLGHGFGLGIGTSAEGWQGEAVAFWENHMNK